MKNQNCQLRSLHRLTGHLLLCLALLLSCSSTASARDRFSESDIAVALLYKVTRFVRWPASSFASDDAALRVCVYPSEQYRAPLRALEQRTVNSRPMEVVELVEGTVISEAGCHVLFFTDPAQLGDGSSLRGLEDQAVLTVGNYREFSEQGGMLSLSRTRSRIEMRIDAAVSKRAGLEYNAQLLELATVLNRD